MRFLHTADWHLGMTRRFLPPEAQARYGDDRIQAVRDMAALASREDCAFVVACGDIFDSNHNLVTTLTVNSGGNFYGSVVTMPSPYTAQISLDDSREMVAILGVRDNGFESAAGSSGGGSKPTITVASSPSRIFGTLKRTGPSTSGCVAWKMIAIPPTCSFSPIT